jgi:RES domain-containing protein
MASTPEPSAWRVDSARRASQSFTGVGASLEGGRWNSAGVPAVYASEHLAMAAQERYVHMPKPLPRGLRLVKFPIRFGRVAVRRLRARELPVDWRAEPVPASTQALGDAWISSCETAILAVPSVLIPEETNFVLNPAHPDFRGLAIGAPEPFSFDPRLARLEEPGSRR